MSHDLVNTKRFCEIRVTKLKKTPQARVTVVHFFSSGFHPEWRVYCINRIVQSSEYKKRRWVWYEIIYTANHLQILPTFSSPEVWKDKECMCSGVVIRVQRIASMTMNIPVWKMWENHLYQRSSFSVRPSHCSWTRMKKQLRAMTLKWFWNDVTSGLQFLKASSSCRQGTKKHSERILRAHAAVPPVVHHCNGSKGLMRAASTALVLASLVWTAAIPKMWWSCV